MKIINILVLGMMVTIPFSSFAEDEGIKETVRPSRQLESMRTIVGGVDTAANSLYVDLVREMDLAERIRKEQSSTGSFAIVRNEVEDKLSELKNLTASLETKLDNKSSTNENLKLLVTLYESLGADQAAELLKRMPFTVSLNMIQMMSPKKASKILAAMDPKNAAEVSRRLIKMPSVASNTTSQEAK